MNNAPLLHYADGITDAAGSWFSEHAEHYVLCGGYGGPSCGLAAAKSSQVTCLYCLDRLALREIKRAADGPGHL